MLLEVKNLTKSFGGLMAIRGVDFTINEGEILGLIGPNGAGKTTLFSLITGFLRPTQGQIIFQGRDISGVGPHLLSRQGLCRTFQLVKPFGNMTVLENVMVGALNRTKSVQTAREIARRAVEFVGLGEKRDEMARTLPIGHRKRLEVARALASSPKLLLLDEVMGGLNHAETREMLGLIKEIRSSGVTLFVIEHNMAAVMSVSDRIITLHHGEKIAEGSPAEIARDPRVIQAYLGREYAVAQG